MQLGMITFEILQAAEAGQVKASLENKRVRSYWDKNQETKQTSHSIILAPRVSEPVEALQLVISQLQVLTTNVRRLFLQGNEPRSLLQYLEKKTL